MIGKLIAFALLAAPLGIVLGILFDGNLIEALAAALFMTGSAVLGLALVLALVVFLEGILFRSPDRWRRFN